MNIAFFRRSPEAGEPAQQGKAFKSNIPQTLLVYLIAMHQPGVAAEAVLIGNLA